MGLLISTAHIPHSVPQIFINLTPVAHVQPDVPALSRLSRAKLIGQICLLGDADTIVNYLSHRLGWTVPPALPTITRHPPTIPEPETVQFVSGVGPLYVYPHVQRDYLG
jgi:NAD-dependent histone deacetylase SIR2